MLSPSLTEPSDRTQTSLVVPAAIHDRYGRRSRFLSPSARQRIPARSTHDDMRTRWCEVHCSRRGNRPKVRSSNYRLLVLADTRIAGLFDTVKHTIANFCIPHDLSVQPFVLTSTSEDLAQDRRPTPLRTFAFSPGTPSKNMLPRSLSALPPYASSSSHRSTCGLLIFPTTSRLSTLQLDR